MVRWFLSKLDKFDSLNKRYTNFLEALFRKYGLPEYIRSDNSPPFGNAINMWGFTKLTVWWISLGIKIDRSAPGHPEHRFID